ncbi:MAG: hypothetical protein ACREGR_04060 [Minisyncoccia bacterium]
MGKASVSQERRKLEKRILELEPIRSEDDITEAEALRKMRKLPMSQLREAAQRLERALRARSPLKPLREVLKASTALSPCDF